MAGLTFDTFLPSGGLEQTNHRSPACGSFSASVSPLAVPPRSLSPYILQHIPGFRTASPTPCSSGSYVQNTAQNRDQSNISDAQLTSPPHQNGLPLLSQLSRYPTAEDSYAAQIQNWRVYTEHLRQNARGERAHMEADRARMDEVMAEERALWDQERELLKGRIVELESHLAALLHIQNQQQGAVDFQVPPRDGQSPQKSYQRSYNYKKTMAVSSNDVNSNSARSIHQESGRNPDGSPFYAPAPQNPSRTFEASPNNDLRVDSMSAPRETPIRVTSKELSESDFGPRSPPIDIINRDGSESIDISRLQPELEGVPIRASAVTPAFAAQVISTNTSVSPTKPLSHVSSPPRQNEMIKVQSGLSRSASKTRKTTLEVITAPETHRLVMNAGHTPNHSIHKIDIGDSGGATPTQNQHRLEHPSMAIGNAEGHDENIDPDPELQGPLGLKNDPPKDELFLAALTNKLKEIRESALVSSSEVFVDSEGLNSRTISDASSTILGKLTIVSTSEALDDDHDDSKQDVVPVLRVKASMNFGRPFGSL